MQTPPIPAGFSTTPPVAQAGPPPIPAGFSTTPPATPAPRRAAAAPARRRNAAPAAAPVVDEASEPLIRDAQTTAEGTTYTVRPLAPGDTPESLTAEGREFNPVTNTWEFPRGLEDVEVQGSRPEMLPMVRPPAAPPQGNLLEQAGEGLLRNPQVGPLISGAVGIARGVNRTAGNIYGLLGQAADRLGLDGIGNAMIGQADEYQNAMTAYNAPFREAQPLANQTGQFAGEVAATAPIAGAVGQTIARGGRGLAAVAPRAGAILERVGQATSAGGFLPSAVRPPAAGAAPAIGERLGNLAVRGSGGAISGATQSALIDPEDAAGGAAIGALLPTIAARPAKWALNRVLAGYEALTGQLGRTRAAEIVRQSLGVDYDAAVAALRNAAPDVTAQQALVDAGVPADVFMAVGEAGRAADPRAFRVISDAQEAARQARLTPAQGAVQAAEMAGDAAAARVQQQQFRTVQAGEQLVGEAQAAARAVPREGAAALEDLRVGADEASGFYAANRAQAQRAIDDMAGGTNLTAARTSEAAAKQALRDATAPMRAELLAAADASGTLTVAPISERLMQMADAPGVGTTNSRVLARVAAELDAMAARRGGVPSAEDIYAFRKDDLDDIITSALSTGRGGEITSQAARRGQTVREVQQMVDKQLEDAIRAAGGPEWQAYLDTYSAGMRALERQEMMGVAGWMLRQNPTQFSNLLRGESPDAVEGIFGRGRIDLADTLEPGQLDALKNAAAVLDQEADVAGRFTAQNAETGRVTARAKTDADIALEAARARAAQEAAAANAMAGDVVAQNAMAVRRAEGDLAAVEGMNEGELTRDRRVGAMAAQGSAAARDLFQQQPGRGPVRRLFNFMSRAKPVTAAAMEFGSMLVDAKVAPQIRRALAQAYQSGANMDELLAMVPLATQAQMARNMMNPSFWSHLTGAATNAMSPPAQ